MATIPPDYLTPLLHSIESGVLEISDEYPQISDRDIELVYEQLRKYFQLKAKSKQAEEPIYTSEKNQDLSDEILNMIDVREEIEADSPFIRNDDFRPGGVPIPSLEAFYVMGFKRLLSSVRFWRKQKGTTYLQFIREHVI